MVRAKHLAAARLLHGLWQRQMRGRSSLLSGIPSGWLTVNGRFRRTEGSGRTPGTPPSLVSHAWPSWAARRAAAAAAASPALATARSASAAAAGSSSSSSSSSGGGASSGSGSSAADDDITGGAAAAAAAGGAPQQQHPLSSPSGFAAPPSAGGASAPGGGAGLASPGVSASVMSIANRFSTGGGSVPRPAAAPTRSYLPPSGMTGGSPALGAPRTPAPAGTPGAASSAGAAVAGAVKSFVGSFFSAGGQ